MIPTGADRFDFSTFDQTIGAAIVDMKWSNSPAALASIPARIVILDEVDKFNEGGAREANAVDLAEQRTKSFSNPKRVKTSTPTLVSGLIWQEFLKTDQRRRYVPCPHCGKFVVLIWSKAYTVFKLTGDEAEAVWDKRAKRKDGTWDLERVATSSHYRCPHCAGHITDSHKTLMDRGGVWRATAPAARGYRGWHLSSLYAASAQTNVGTLAVKFLQAKESLLGLQGFINGDLAEPYQAQDTVRERVDVVTSRQQSTDEWAKVMTVDCQAKAPHFWFVVRAWREGVSEGLEAGSVDSWEELRAIQERHGIPDVQVAVDSGFGARSDAEVYKACVQFSEVIAMGEGAIAVGWMPTKGMPGSKRWREEQTGTLVPWYLAKIDPFLGTADAGRVSQSLFEFSGDFFKDILDKLRSDKTKWTVSAAMSSEEYWRHMEGEVKKVRVNARTGFRSYEWQARGKHWPQHLWDCETAQIAVATFHKFFALQ
jgi:DNA-directed RNA polymerase subunit RPC12/RpoP